MIEYIQNIINNTYIVYNILICLFIGIIGGILYRIRGGWLPTGSTTLARLIWVIPTSILLSLVVHFTFINFFIVLIFSIIACWIAYAVIGHSAHMTMGQLPPEQWSPADGNFTEIVTFWLPKIMKRENNRVLYDMIGMSFIGFCRGLLISLPLVYFNPLTLLFAPIGLLHGPVYYLSWKIGPKTEGGEVATGFYTWFIIALFI